jgi:hypothetical protein
LQRVIKSDGSIDPWYYGYNPVLILGFTGHLNRDNFSFNAKIYGGDPDDLGYYLGIDYYFIYGKSSPFLGLDLATYRHTEKVWRNNFSTTAIAGYCLVPDTNLSLSSAITMMARTSYINVEGNEYWIPEMGLGLNLFMAGGFFELSPEVFIVMFRLPIGSWSWGVYPGIKLGITF